MKGGDMKTQAVLAEPKPYHHGDLRRALLRAAVVILEREGPSALSLRAVLGVAYVEFSRAHPALYRVMWDSARNGEKMPESDPHEESAFDLVKQTLRDAAGGQISDLDLELTAIASWCAAHGLAEISTFAQFQPLKDALGGERAFLQGVLEHLGGIRRHVT